MKKRIAIVLMVVAVCLSSFTVYAIEATPRAATYYYTITNTVLRRNASSDSDALLVITAFTRLPVHDIEDGWALVQYGSTTGYVSQSCLIIASAVKKIVGAMVVPLYTNSTTNSQYSPGMDYGTKVHDYGKAGNNRHYISPLEGALLNYSGYCNSANLGSVS